MSTPELVDPRVSRDFVYVDDVTDAFVTIAGDVDDRNFGESFCKYWYWHKVITIGDLAVIAGDLFGLEQEPRYTMPNREWALPDCVRGSKQSIGALRRAVARTPVREGLSLTMEWYRTIVDKERHWQSSKKFGLDTEEQYFRCVIASL